MGFIGLLKNAFALVNAWLTGAQRTEDKKSGARQVENKEMKEGIDAGKHAKKVRKDKPKRTRRGHTDRL